MVLHWDLTGQEETQIHNNKKNMWRSFIGFSSTVSVLRCGLNLEQNF